MTRSVLALDGGTSYHAFSLSDTGLESWFTRRVYIGDVTEDAVDGADVIVVPCRLNPDWMADNADLLLDALGLGKTLVVMGETEPHTWIPGVDFTGVPTNFWWWLEPGAELGLRINAPGHGLFRYITLNDATWHYHGFFRPAPGAASLIEAPEGGAVLVDDQASWPGRLVLTSLDPFYHHGSFFMPAATRFLRGFTRWIGDGMR